MGTNTFMTDRRVVFVLALLACLLWGSAFPAIKSGFILFNIQADDIPGKILFAGYRFALAGLILLVAGVVVGKKIFALHGQDYVRVTVLGLLMTTCQYIFFYVGLANTTGVKGAIINGTTTFFYVLLARFAFKAEQLNIFIVAGCLIGFLGVISVNFSSSFTAGFTLMGDGFMILAALVQAVAGLFGKKISEHVDPWVMTGWQLAIGGVVLVAGGLLLGGEIHGYTVKSTSLLIYMALLSSVAFALFASLLKYNPVSMVTVFQFTTPLFGAMLSALFLGEKLMEWKNLGALVCVCFGIYLVSHYGQRK